VKNPIRNETSLVLVVAVIFSAVAIPVLSGFLEPSQPPAVAAVQIGQPRDDDQSPAGEGAAAGQSETGARERSPSGDAQPRRRSSKRDAPAPSMQPAPSAPADEAAEDDGGEAD
jgi:hypothetical protein